MLINTTMVSSGGLELSMVSTSIMCYNNIVVYHFYLKKIISLSAIIVVTLLPL